MKKVTAVLMSFAMFFAICPFAFAATPTPLPPKYFIDAGIDSSPSYLADYTDAMEYILAQHTDVYNPYNVGIPITAIYEQIGGGPTYKIDVSWGEMKFTYQSTSGKRWNPYEHEYEVGLGEGSGWAASCIAPTNNVITITNHSAFAVGSTFNYDILKDLGPNAAPTLSLTPWATVSQLDTMATRFATNGLSPVDPNHNYYYSDDIGNGKDNFGNAGALTNNTAVFFFPTANYFNSGDNIASDKVFENGARAANFYFALTGKPQASTFSGTIGEILIDFYPCGLGELSYTDGMELSGGVLKDFASPLKYSKTDGRWGLSD